MPEPFPDPMAKWTPVPDWSSARLTRPEWSAASVEGLTQILLSGDLAAAFRRFALQPPSVGLWGIAPTPAALRIGRDRALLVSSQVFSLESGWQEAGWAATDASDAYHVFALAGPTLREIVAEATSADVDGGSPAATIQFAGVPALLYRTAAHQARLHVEAAFAPYVWRWLETR